MLSLGQVADVNPSIEQYGAVGETLWIVDEEHERPPKETDFQLATFGRVPSRKDSMSNLRINTSASTDFHERYMESEEEPSPSPDSEPESTSSKEEEPRHKVPAASIIEPDAPTESSICEDSKTEIATAVPIMVVGRPKLVDISSLAPMQKRKRMNKQPSSRSLIKHTATHIAAPSGGDGIVVVEEPAKAVTPEEHLPQRKDSLSIPAPDSWLPDDVTIVQEEDDHHLPLEFDLRRPPSYNDYDPYSLDPPRLSPRNSYHSSKKPGSIARARSNTPITSGGNGWKGLSRSLSLAKRQALHRGDQQIAKRPKMIARAADDRGEPVMIPAYPLDESDRKVSRG